MWYYKGKKYFNVNEWVGIFNRDYAEQNIRVKARDIHQLFHHYGLKPIKTNVNREVSENGTISWYSESAVNYKRYREDFMQTLYNIVTFGDSRGMESVYQPSVKDNDEEDYDTNYENDMEKYSKYLEMTYNENIKKTINKSICEWVKKNTIPIYNDDDKIELVKDKNVVNGGNFPIKRNGKEYWVSRSMTISLYVFCKNENDEWCILASLRGPKVKFGANKWNVVCGFLDYGYTLEETAVKECYEETGVKISVDMLRKHGVNSSRVRGDVNARFSVVLDGDIKNYPTSISNCEEGEVSNAKWIPLSEISNYNWWNKQGQKVLDVSQNVINSHNLNTNEDYKTIVSLLQKLVNENSISEDIYKQIIKLLKKE